LEKLSAYESACVVVECNFRDLVDGRYRSDAHPHALIGTVASIVVDFGVPVYFCSDRQAACRFVEEYLTRFHRRIARCQKEMRVTRRDSGEE
jgi:ERCC4-type nuclease